MSAFHLKRRGVLNPEERRLQAEIASYGDEYRAQLMQAAAKNAEQHRANGEVCVAGCWVREDEAARVRSGLLTRQTVAAIEARGAVALTLVFAYLLWQLFTFLFLP